MNVVPAADISDTSKLPPSPAATPHMATPPGDPKTPWYQNKENLYIALQHYLSISSQGSTPIVPLVGKIDGTPLDVRATLELPCYAGFPADEKAKWLEGVV
jgi:hypothetical protein